jgi:acyl-coenzyme A thioesterase PaaI-like protein
MKLPRLGQSIQSLRHSTGIGRGYSRCEAYFSDTRKFFPSSASVQKFSTCWPCKSNTPGEGSDFLEQFINSREPSQATLDHFKSLPWTTSYLQEPRYQIIPFFSRQLNPITGENFFFAQTINTPTTIPHVLALRSNALKPLSTKTDITDSAPARAAITSWNQSCKRPSTKVLSTAQDTVEALIFLHLGTGLNAHPSIVHGGVICVIFDEAFRLLVLLHQNIAMGRQAGPRDQHFTVQFNTSYLMPIRTPTDILVKCWLVRREGRKWFMKAQIVSETEVVLMESESLWVTARRKADG